jgi:cytochrome c-type biogenesis protein CcmH
MTIFWIICALFLVIAVLFVVLPLIRGTAKGNQVLRDAANLDIFRDQIAEMDADLNNGLLTPELYEQGKRELQVRMLEEVKTTDSIATALVSNPHKVLAIILALLIPLVAVGLYWKVGTRQAILSTSEQVARGGMGSVHTEDALKELENKIASNPQDVESMQVLARSYAEMGRFAEATQIYEKLSGLTATDAQMWADFADALAMTSGQKLSGRPVLLINTALSIDANNPKALALAGSAAMERGDAQSAIKYWEHLLAMLEPGSEDEKMISNGIQQARQAMGQGMGSKAMPGPFASNSGQQSSAASGEGISGTVTLSDALKAQANPTDTLFVLARAKEGPPMPLAVIRKQVKDLPLQFNLDDSMAMSQQMKLSAFDKVVVVARISKSGEPMPHAGDLQGMSATLTPGSKGVKLSIDTLVK